MLNDVFIDESSQTKHRYLLLGGLISRLPELELDRVLNDARGRELPFGEMAWVKVSQSKLFAYRRFVDVFFRGEIAGLLDFHSIVVDTHLVDDRTYNGGSRSAGFDKEIYQLILKFGREYRSSNFHVYLDQRSSPTPLSQLREIANRGMMQLLPRRDWPVRRLHYRNSAESQAMQMVDILLGGVAFHLNGHRQRSGASAAKCELSDHVLNLAGIANVFQDTAKSGKFTIWHRQLRPPRRGHAVNLP